MKKIKSFKTFESGVAYSEYRDVAKKIKELLNSERFIPHTNQTNRWTNEERKFAIYTDCTKSKWGLVFDIVYKLDEPINLNVVNDGVKFSFLDVIELLLDYYPDSKITLSKFSYFDEKVEGQKNGHTKEIEDVQEKAIEIIERLGETDRICFEYCPISYQIVVK